MTLNMRKLLICALTLLLPCMMVGATKDKLELHANLVGIQEVVAGTIVTNATGTFTATINDDSSLTYTLTYKDLSSSVLQAHIRVGASKVAGNITIFLCSNLSNGPADTPACPDDSTHSGTVTRTISAADVTDHSLYFVNGSSVKSAHQPSWIAARCSQNCVVVHGDEFAFAPY
jgi:CHRD domain